MTTGRQKSPSEEIKRRMTAQTNKEFRINIFSAVKKHYHENLTQLLETIGFADVMDLKCETPLNVVSKKIGSHRSRKTAKILIMHGADIFWPDCGGSTPAAYFLKSKHEELIDIVLKKLDDVNTPLDSDGNRALHLAVDANLKHTVCALLKKGADPNILNRHGYTAIHKALTEEAHNLMPILIHHGGNIDLPGPNSLTPLQMAVQMKNSDCINYVFYCGPDLSVRDQEGYTPLMYLIRNVNYLIPQIFELIDEGAEPNDRMSNGDNCLHILARDANLEKYTMRLSFLIRLLLQYEVNINDCNKEGDTALHIAIRQDKPMTAYMLLRYGADLTHRSGKERPLDVAFMMNNHKILSIFARFIALRGWSIFEYTRKIHHIEKISFFRVQLQGNQSELDSLKEVVVFGTNITYYNLLKMNLRTMTKHVAKSLALRDLHERSFHPQVRLYRRLLKWKLEDAVRFWKARKAVADELDRVLKICMKKISIPKEITKHIVTFLDFHDVLIMERYLSDELEDDYETDP